MTLLLVPGAMLLAACSGRKQDRVTVTVSDRVLVKDVMRFGVNTGTWTAWGAEQLSSNVIKNPGFEGMIDRAIVIVRDVVAGGFDDNDPGLGRPDGFWNGGRYEVLSGDAAGQAGVIVASAKRGPFGYPSFTTSQAVAGAKDGDAVAVTRISEKEEPADWWFTRNPGARYEPETENRAPGSGGTRSLRIAAAGIPAEAISYLDAIGDRAGKLLPVSGEWRLTFWSRLDRGSARLRVSLGRAGTSSVLLRDVSPGSGWQKTEYLFTASDDGPATTLALKFEVQGNPAGEILLDDVELRRTSDSDSPFRSEVHTILKMLHPGFLRDWQGQLGDTAPNRLAGTFARKTTRYRPGDNAQADYAYGLPESLDLALESQASPWIIIPPTFSPSECGVLGKFLSGDRRYGSFAEVLVEFGNENWNAVFRPAGIGQPLAMGQAADRCFAEMRRNAGSVKLRTTINAQHANPDSVEQFSNGSRRADLLAVAPYFLHELPTGLAPDKAARLLFGGDGGRMARIAGIARAAGKEAAAYEVGLHTDEGSATEQERTQVTSGMASGSALARTMMDALALGVRRQCVYTLAGFDNRTRDGKGFVRLWGITRDLGERPRLRPAGLALQLMNRAIQGAMVKAASDDPDVYAYGFRRNDRWSVVIVSGSPGAKSVDIRLPAGSQKPTTFARLVATSSEATNEDSQSIAIMSSSIGFEDEIATVNIPPFGLAILVDGEGGK
jgi:hypothetical protein